jgi:hypothetical protein
MTEKDGLKQDPGVKKTRAKSRKGGAASKAAGEERKLLCRELAALLAAGDTQEKVCLALVEQALGGSTRAFEVLRDTLGEKAADRKKVEASIGLTDADRALLEKVSRRMEPCGADIPSTAIQTHGAKGS